MTRHRAAPVTFQAEKVKAARIAHGLTNEDFAHDLGVTLRTVQRWQTPGLGGPSGFQLLQLCRMLELDPGTLYLEDGAAA